MVTPGGIVRALRALLVRLLEPLRADDSVEHFTLAIPEAQTTTVDSVQGWRNRPPAVLRCRGCDAEIPQARSHDAIDCPNCWRSAREDEFSEHELLGLVCPRCGSELEHGIRHPMVFDVPEWATCPDCRFHWDLDHWF